MSLPGAAGKGGSGSRSESGRRDQRFPRSSRLTSRRQFRTVYREGYKVQTPWFVLFGLPNGAGTSRLGVTVTRKVGSSVQRNRAKRRLREVFRRHRSELLPPLDLVANAKVELLAAAFAVVEREFLRCFSQLARRAGRRR